MVFAKTEKDIERSVEILEDFFKEHENKLWQTECTCVGESQNHIHRKHHTIRHCCTFKCIG